MSEPYDYITDNVILDGRVGSFKWRNLIEAGSITFALIFGILKIPFVPKVKIIVCLCFGFATFVIAMRGHKGQSPTEIIINIIKERFHKEDYHMRSINDEYSEEEITGHINESLADVAIRKIKEFIRERID